MRDMIFISLVMLILWIYLRWRKLKRYWADRKVPYLEPHPILGNLTFLLRQNTGLWMREMYNRYKDSPYFGIWLFWRPALVINSPEIAKRILIKDSDNFRNRFVRAGKTDPVGSLTLFTVKEPIWSSIRRRLTPMFTSAKLKSLHGLMSKKSSELVQRIHNDNESGAPIELRSIFTDLATDIIGTAAFGVKSDAILKKKSELRMITEILKKFGIMRGINWIFIFFFPDLVDIFRFTVWPKDAVTYFRKIYYSITSQRDRDRAEHKDLLDALMKIKREAKENNEEISDDVLIAQAVAFLQAGVDTTAANLTYLIYELGFDIKAQEKLYKQIIEEKYKLGDEEFNLDSLLKIKYLDCLINETLRLYPPMGFLDRVADKDYKIDDNLTIPAGTPVYVNAVGMQCDPDYFQDPMVFNPDRFLPENEKNVKPFTYMPFGEGPRMCIGERFAYMVMRYAVAAIILNYEVRRLPNSTKPRDCTIEKNHILLMPGTDMIVEFVPRRIMFSS